MKNELKRILKEIIVSLQERLAEIEKSEKPASVWALKKGDECWVITGPGRVIKYPTFAAKFQHRRMKGDVFLTEAAAEAELIRRRIQAGTKLQGLI